MRGSRSSSRGTTLEVDPNGCPSFFKIYSGESSFSCERILVPRAFMEAHEEKLCRSSWTLKPEDGGLRRMKIERHGTDSFICQRDWEEFARDLNLQFGDIVVFFLVGISEFEVMIFSQTTSCRIISPPSNKTARADHDAFLSSSDDDDDAFSSSSDDDDDDDDDDEIIKAPRKGRKSKRKSSCNYAHASGSGSSKRSKLASGKGIQVKTESTESDMEDGFQMKRFSNVNLTAKFPYFEIIVKKSHKDAIFVPVEFARETGIIHEKAIKMMSSENGSCKKLEIQVVNNRVLMVKGWKPFRTANNIKVGDKCSFTLVNPNSHGAMRLLVKKLPKC